MENEVVVCPKCGFINGYTVHSHIEKKVQIICDDCGYIGPYAIDEDMALEFFNNVKVEKSDATNPTHYSRWKIEPLDFIMANNLDFLRGNIIKYIMRYDAKGGLEDLKKARNYLDSLIAKTEKEAKND